MQPLSSKDQLFMAHLMWEQGDLVEYQRPGSRPVRGRVTLVYGDVTGVFVVVRVTSRTHPLYACNTELEFKYDEPKLHFRRRGNRQYRDEDF